MLRTYGTAGVDEEQPAQPGLYRAPRHTESTYSLAASEASYLLHHEMLSGCDTDDSCDEHWSPTAYRSESSAGQATAAATRRRPASAGRVALVVAALSCAMVLAVGGVRRHRVLPTASGARVLLRRRERPPGAVSGSGVGVNASGGVAAAPVPPLYVSQNGSKRVALKDAAAVWAWDRWVVTVLFGHLHSGTDTEEGRVGFLLNQFNVDYVAEVAIGSPSVHYALVVDTGSARTWVAGAECAARGCRGMTRYNASASSTFVGSEATTTGFFAQYGAGWARGYLGTDTVSLSDEGSAVRAFGIATNVSDFFGSVGMDGMLGLGLPAAAGDSRSSGGAVAAAAAAAAGPGGRRACGLYLAKDAAGPGPSSQLVFGGRIDGSEGVLHRGRVRYTPVLPMLGGYLHYIVEFDGFWVDGQRVDLQCGPDPKAFPSPCRAVVDGGTSLLLGPEAPMAKTLAALGAPGGSGGGGCSAKAAWKTLEVGIGGVRYSVPPSVYLGAEEEACAPGIAPAELIPGLFVFGETFLRAVYTVFDASGRQVGFAPHADLPAVSRSA